MTFLKKYVRLATAALMLGLASTSLADEPAKSDAPGQGRGPMGRGRGQDSEFANDRDTFHFLLTNHKEIQRTVKNMDNGVETVTESTNPDVAKKIQEHVPAMYKRLQSGQGVRYWDPLFAEAFQHGKKMVMEITNTDRGVKVVETATDPVVVKIIQAHAEVVSKFAAHGFEEARKEHPVPVEDAKK